jgi:competence protein ComEA
MEAQATKKKAGATTASKGLVGRARAVIADSAWGALAGKGVLAVAGFVVLALVGSGKLGEISPRVGVAQAATVSASASPSAGASAAIKAGPAPESSASVSVSVSSSSSGGGESADAGDAKEPAVTPDGKVRINVATEPDLRRLPGIGATRAKAILALRERLGRFRRPEDLLRVKGIGRRMLGRLRPLLILDP